MSSLKKAANSGQKTHRERGQLSSRRHLGLLEKKKDYKLRARNFHRKDDYLKALKKKALDKNPEEFYYNMVNSKLVDGVHHAKHKEEVLTDEQKKLMQSQDLRYVTYKKVLESKKIEKLKANLHLLEESEEKPKNKHTFFVDSDREAKKFNLAKRLNTHPELLPRRHNRPTLETLQKARIQGDIDKDSLEYLAKERSKRYKELSSRIDREKELKIVEQKMEVKKNLMDNRKKKEEKKETAHSAAVYKWAMQRKR